MSDKFRATIKKELKYCLPKKDWEEMLTALTRAGELFKQAEEISDSDWAAWTSELGSEQGFPSIIYHDQPIIIKPELLPFTLDNKK